MKKREVQFDYPPGVEMIPYLQVIDAEVRHGENSEERAMREVVGLIALNLNTLNKTVRHLTEALEGIEELLAKNQ